MGRRSLRWLQHNYHLYDRCGRGGVMVLHIIHRKLLDYCTPCVRCGKSIRSCLIAKIFNSKYILSCSLDDPVRVKHLHCPPQSERPGKDSPQLSFVGLVAFRRWILCTRKRHSGKIDLSRSSRSCLRRCKSSLIYQLLMSPRLSHPSPSAPSLRLIPFIAR